MPAQVDQPCCPVWPRFDKTSRNHSKIDGAAENAVEESDCVARMTAIEPIKCKINARLH
jgi:hypothetical protein